MENVQSKHQLIQTSALRNSSHRLYARYAHLIMVASLVFSDVLMICASGVIASSLRNILLGPGHQALLNWLPALALLFTLVFVFRGLYPAVGMGVIGEFRSLTITISMIYLIVSSFSFIMHSVTPLSRLAFVFMWVLSLALVPAGRIMIRAILARAGCWGEPAALIGPAALCQEIAERYWGDLKTGIYPLAIFSPFDQQNGSKTKIPVNDIKEMMRYSASHHIHTALVIYSSLDELPVLRERYQDTFERIILIRENDDDFMLSGLSVGEYDGSLSFEIRYNLLDRWAQRQKRVMDLMGSGAGLILLSPLLALMALLIKLESPGPVFYRQKRMGKKRKVVGIVKFRTMLVNADQMLQEYLAENPEKREEWDRYQKLHEDPRITRVGVWLRRFSIDELPQLWNVLQGQMSLVGPRPIMLNQETQYGDNLKHYVRVLPGITGMWQISGRNHTTFAQRADFDLNYVMNWSIWLDIYILVRTIWVVLSRDGAC
ncbi:MAG: undecaprenyl-phosphate galactose phosphotransferase WbaP [Anaerolineaceae bacterium]|nr:undecaprenyl-phosphate galactose phosphotransferase WbaP [Anaerolineaceae bacterium]